MAEHSDNEEPGISGITTVSSKGAESSSRSFPEPHVPQTIISQLKVADRSVLFALCVATNVSRKKVKKKEMEYEMFY